MFKIGQAIQIPCDVTYLPLASLKCSSFLWCLSHIISKMSVYNVIKVVKQDMSALVPE